MSIEKNTYETQLPKSNLILGYSKRLFSNLNFLDKEKINDIINFFRVLKIWLSDIPNLLAIILLSLWASYPIIKYLNHLSNEFYDDKDTSIAVFEIPTPNLIDLPDIHSPINLKIDYRVWYLSIVAIILAASFWIYRTWQLKEAKWKAEKLQEIERKTRLEVEEKVKQLEQSQIINKQLLESYQSVNGRLLAILDNMFDWVVEIQKINDEIVINYVNNAACQIFGYEKSELLWNQLSILLPTNRVPNHDKIISWYFMDQNNLPEIIWVQRKIYWKKKNWEIFPIEIWIKKHIENWEPIIISFIDDITEREEANRKLSEAMKREEMSNRIKSNLLGNISHEVRTPLNWIIWYCSLAEIQWISIDQLIEYCKIAKEQWESLLARIEVRTNLSEIEESKCLSNIENIDSRLMIEMCIEKFQKETIRKNLKVHNHASSSIWFKWNYELLSMALSETLSNAIKFSNKEWIITIGHSIQNWEISILVKDDWEWIEKNNINMIWNYFYMENDWFNRQHQSWVWAGLKLVNAIINKHHWKLKIDSEWKWLWTTVTITLPLEQVDNN